MSDVIADPEMDAGTRSSMDSWTGFIAGALTRVGFEHALVDAGLTGVEIRAPSIRATSGIDLR